MRRGGVPTAIIALACAAIVALPAADAGAGGNRRHGNRNSQHRDHGKGNGRSKQHGHDKGSKLGDKPIAGNSCAKRVHVLKKQLAKLSYLPKANGSCMGEDDMWAIQAFQKQEQLHITGKADRHTLKKLAHAKAPRPRKNGENDRLLVSLKRQVLYIVEHDKVRRTIAVASGRTGFNTPRGHYKIFRKERNSFSQEFNVNLPWASYFHNGMAFHGSPDVEARPASHGCIRVPPVFAREVYRKAPIGRQVIVF